MNVRSVAVGGESSREVRGARAGLCVAVLALVVLSAGLLVGVAHAPASAPRAVGPVPNPGLRTAGGSTLQCDGMYWTSQVWGKYVPSYCYGHDEPTVSYISKAPGSGSNASLPFWLPSDSTTESQADLFATFWVGGVVYDTRSTAGGSQGFLELQFYPAPPAFTGSGSGAQDCLPNGAFNPVYTFHANQWFACAIVWQIRSTIFGTVEDAAFAGPVDSGSTSAILVMHSGDYIVVTLKGTAKSSTTGWGITVSDKTASTSGSVTLKNGTLALPPYYATAKTSSILTWGASGPGAIAFAYEIGHSLNGSIPQPGGACSPGDGVCDGYWPGVWGASGPARISLPRLGNGVGSFPAQVGFSSSQGGALIVNGSSCGSPSFSTSTNCMYPFFRYRSASYSFDFGASVVGNATYTYASKYQFPSGLTVGGNFVKRLFPSPVGTVNVNVLPITATVDLNPVGSTHALLVSGTGFATGKFVEGPYFLNVSAVTCTNQSQSLYLKTGTVNNFTVHLTCTGSWRSLTTSGSPTARSGAAMAYDPAGGDTVLFGGTNGTATFGDTWTYLAGTWTKLLLRHHPSAWSGASLVDDPADHALVLFGGESPTGTALADTWTFSSGRWTQISPATSPSGRFDAVAAYDSADGYLVLFGGFGPGATTLGDTWTFHAGVWTRLAPAVAPAARGLAGLADDPADGYVVLFGGETAAASGTLLGDTWTFHAGAWTHRAVVVGPSSRAGMMLTNDPARGYVVLFGGERTNATYAWDTWKFVGGHWTHLTTYHAPASRAEPASAYDGSDQYLVLFGGDAATALSGTWEYF